MHATLVQCPFFYSGVSIQRFPVRIVDDLGRPELEGVEAFDVVLRMPVGGAIGAPNRTTVFINDTNDGPTFCFKKSEYKGDA